MMAKESGQSKKKTKFNPAAHNFPIVGIGASAGGLDAFKKLLESIPKDSDMAYVVVQHLNPTYESNLTEILSRVTEIPIEEITDEVLIVPNHIYVMPAGKILTTIDGVLKLTPRDSVKTNLVIDIFFTSIAVVWESMAVGVVLSGTGADGTVGLKMIKEHGGITIAQDESAAYGAMPQSAVDANVVDFVLPAERIPDQLLKINRSYASAHAIGEEKPLPKNDELIIMQILQVLHQSSGVDFKHYKQSTVHRRIGRRMALHKRGNLTDYFKFLRSDKTEQEALFQDMLISVTSFFRDSATFEALSETVFPALLKNKENDNALRFWIAGCATGEETYSIAICLHEYLRQNPTGIQIQIFASDISENAISKARAGIYSKDKLQNISDKRLSYYFTKTDGGYRVNKNIRDLCVFANHNFLKDPPFARMDLISCRNVLIYMDTFLQKRALSTFHYALKEGGLLLLGKSESVSAAAELFTSFDKTHKIYSRKSGSGHFMPVATRLSEQTFAANDSISKKKVTKADFRDSADAILISKSPAAVVINAEMDIVHIHGDIEPFLKHLPGKPSLNLLKMAREGLAFELRSAMNKIKTGQNSVIKKEIPFKTNRKKALAAIEIIKLINTVEPHYLILFTKTHLPAKEEILTRPIGDMGATLKRNEQLEKELAETREDMLSITENMEAANEELQSSNEELQSVNEEIQSFNEELETSKEELQSTNEELIILNQELNEKQEQYNASREYAESIISTIKEPLIVLDKNFRVKSANTSFYKKFHLTEKEAEGYLFYELQNHRWDDIELRKALEKILPENKKIEDFEMILDERIMLLNAREILSEKNTQQLILLAIEDVTDSRMVKKLKKSEAAQAKIASHLKLATDSANLGTWLLDVKTQKLEWNALHKKMWGFNEHKDIKYDDWLKLIDPADKEKVVKLIELAEANRTMYDVDYRINRADDGVTRYIQSVGKFNYNDTGKAETFTGISIDITKQKEAESQSSILASIIKGSDNAIISKDLKGIITSWNPAAEKIFGYKAEEAVGKSIKMIIPPERLKEESEILNRIANGKIIDHMYTQRIGKSGNLIELSITVSPIKDSSGKIVGASKIARNITERRRAKEKIKASEAKFRTLSENIPHMVWTSTPDGKKNFFNKFYLDYTGKTYEELAGDGWQLTVMPGDREKALKQWQKGMELGEDCKIEKRIQHHDGTYRWHLCHSNVQKDEEGKIIGWIGTNTEIEEQVKITEALAQKEEQFRTFANSIQNLAWIANGEGWIYWYNQRWLDYTGLTLKEMEGWGWQKVHHPDHVEKMKELTEQSWKKGEAFELIFPLRRHDGEYRWFLTNALPLKDADGNVERWIGTNTDITEQKSFTEALEEKVHERTEELHKMNVQLEHTNAELTSFSYVASHDLQEPLRKIQMFSSRILETEYDSLSENAKTYFDRMQRSAYRMQKLIQDLIAYSRVNVKETKFENVHLNEIIEDVKETLSEELEQNDVTFKLRNICDIKIIPVQFTQVLLNLVSNAIKFAKDDQPVVIEIDCEEVKGKETGIASLAEEVDYIHIRVSDNGIGFEPEYNEKIFEVFQRLHGKDEYMGTGIGLAIVKRIIENHDGVILAEGKVNKGATFNMYIPV